MPQHTPQTTSTKKEQPAPAARTTEGAGGQAAGSQAAWNRYVGGLTPAGGGAQTQDPLETAAGREAKAAIPSVKGQFKNLDGGGAKASAELLAGATALTEGAGGTGGGEGPVTAPDQAPVEMLDGKPVRRALPVDAPWPAPAPAPAPAQDEAKADTTTPPAEPTRARTTPKAGTYAAKVYAKHDKMVGSLSSKLNPAQAEDLQAFVAHWKANRGRYEAVAAQTDVPAPLIAAIHWRESTGNFGTYLHQGDPLGKKAVHVPRNIPVFTKWEDAAVHALTHDGRQRSRDDLGIDKGTTDTAAMASYAEMYNGMGYAQRGKASPYVYSGTNAYQGGKYVSDGHYSARAKDQQLGVVSMVGAIGGMDSSIKSASVQGPSKWESLKSGRTLQEGMHGPLVEELQQRMEKAGFPCGRDGKFGPKVADAVRAFQKAKGFTQDGIVGPDVAKKLESPA